LGKRRGEYQRTCDESEIVVAFVHAFVVNRVSFRVDLFIRLHVRELRIAARLG
jgi:hypothetical protein